MYPHPSSPTSPTSPTASFQLAVTFSSWRSMGASSRWVATSGQVTTGHRSFGYGCTPLCRRGVGRRLMKQIEAAAFAIGVRRIVLETAQNQPEAIAFYESIGYHQTA